MELYEILTARRNEIGMSLSDLAEKSGVPKGTVNKIMSGASPNPGITPLIAIAHALGLTLDELDKTEPTAIGGLTEKEAEFINIFGELTPQNRGLLLGIAKLILQSQSDYPDSKVKDF